MGAVKNKSGERVYRDCTVCDKRFAIYRWDQHICSVECRNRQQYLRRQAVLTEAIKSSEVVVSPVESDRTEVKSGDMIDCLQCGVEFAAYRPMSLFCTPRCKGRYHGSKRSQIIREASGV